MLLETITKEISALIKNINSVNTTQSEFKSITLDWIIQEDGSSLPKIIIKYK